MEQSGIVEGFQTSVSTRNLIYGTLIADGDASTYKKILESRPYPNVNVKKIECTNHSLRNFNGKLFNLSKNTAVPLAERKLLTLDRMKRLRIAIRSATRFRNAQNFPNLAVILTFHESLYLSLCEINKEFQFIAANGT